MEARRIPWPGRLAVIPVALASVVAFTLTSCDSNSSGDTSSGNSPTAGATTTEATASPNTQALCQDAKAIRTSISDLANTPLNSSALTTLSDKVDKISTQVRQLSQDAHGSLKPQLDQLSASLHVLKGNIDTAVNNPSASNLAAIGTAAASVGTAANNVRTALPDC